MIYLSFWGTIFTFFLKGILFTNMQIARVKLEIKSIDAH